MQNLDRRITTLECKSAPVTSGLIVVNHCEPVEDALKRMNYTGGPLVLIPAKRTINTMETHHANT